MLDHTSGLPNYTELEDYMPSVVATPSQPWGEDRILDLIKSGKRDFEPNHGWHYSNTGYFLLKRIIETRCECSFSQAIKKLIILPLGLENTYVAEGVVSDRLTPGYSRELNPDGRMENITRKYHPGWCFTGLTAASAADTVTFYQALLMGELLPDSLVGKMCEPIATGSKDPRFVNPCYGLGVMIDTDSKYGTLIGHAGEGPGYVPWVMHLTNFHGRAMTIAVFGNVGPAGIPMLLVHDLLSRIESA